jgi:uncharacterized protein YutE (UPF0331/DUF86 family)
VAEANVALAVEHLREAVRYSQRGKTTYSDPNNPDTLRLIESELRKAFETLNRLRDTFWNANPRIDRSRVGEIRQMLTHDYVEVDGEILWRIVSREVRPLLKSLLRAKIPKGP